MLGQRFIFNYDIQHYLSFTLKLHEPYIHMLGQLYTLGGTSDFYQESSPEQVAEFLYLVSPVYGKCLFKIHILLVHVLHFF